MSVGLEPHGVRTGLSALVHEGILTPANPLANFSLQSLSPLATVSRVWPRGVPSGVPRGGMWAVDVSYASTSPSSRAGQVSALSSTL